MTSKPKAMILYAPSLDEAKNFIGVPEIIPHEFYRVTNVNTSVGECSAIKFYDDAPLPEELKSVTMIIIDEELYEQASYFDKLF